MKRFRKWWLPLLGVLPIVTLLSPSLSAPQASAQNAITIKVAWTSNSFLQEAVTLSSKVYEKEHPNVHVTFDNVGVNLETKVITDVSAGAGEFDAVMVDPWDAWDFYVNHWIVNLSSLASKDPSYDIGGLIPAMRSALSLNGDLYASPFYGESSFLMYRKDLFAKAGLVMPLHPTWQQIATFAKKLNDPAKGMAGICLRGTTGYTDGLPPIMTVINAFGARWFNDAWYPQLTSPAFTKAVQFYVNLTRQYGEKGAATAGWDGCDEVYGSGHAAMWYDATVSADILQVSAPSKLVVENDGYAYAPSDVEQYDGWLHSWALSIPSDLSATEQAATWQWVAWVTGPQFLTLAAKYYGWAAVPPGYRTALYSNPNYLKAVGAIGPITLSSIEHADVAHPTVLPVPYEGLQEPYMPGWSIIGDYFSQQLSGAIVGTESVETALANSQSDILGVVQSEGLYKG